MRQFYLQWPPFPLSWSHYVRLISIADAAARQYYAAEALRGGWSVRQLDRQTSTLAYQRAGAPQRAEGSGPALKIPEAQIKDPFVLEFLGLKDESSEAELEEALIRELEQFLLELGNDFSFIARHKQPRVAPQSYRLRPLVLPPRR